MDLLVEEHVKAQDEKAVVTVGRFNPPTAAHYKMIDLMKKYARANPDTVAQIPIVVIVEADSAPTTRNPLSADQRIKFMQASGKADGVKFLVADDAFNGFVKIRKSGFEPYAIAAGSDRINGYLDLLDEKFRDGDKKIKHIKVPGLSKRKDVDEGGVDKLIRKLKGRESGFDIAETSGTMARRAAELGYQEEFAEIVGLGDKPKLAEKMFRIIKTVLEQGDK